MGFVGDGVGASSIFCTLAATAVRARYV